MPPGRARPTPGPPAARGLPTTTKLLIAVLGVLLVAWLVASYWRWDNSAITDAEFADRVQPTYPQAAVDAGIEGQVVVAITVGPDGRLLLATIRSSSGSTLLDDAALEAARASTYRPATFHGIAIRRHYIVFYTFALAK